MGSGRGDGVSITAGSVVAIELACITNTAHPRLAMVNQNACTYKPVDGEEEGLPRRAVKGFLCSSCWEKLLDALGRVPDLVAHLRSTEQQGQGLTERVQSSFTPQLPIPASWLAADEIMAALGDAFIPSTATLEGARAAVSAALSVWESPERVVATAEGAVRAVELVRHVQTSLARWPNADTDRRVPAPLRCPACHELALWYRAPLEYLDDLEVKCGSCGTPQEWAAFVAMTGDLTRQFEMEQKAAAKLARAERRKAAKA